MMSKIRFCILFFLSLSIYTHAQLNGNITDQNGEALPFASIYLKNTSKGTTSNIEGEYFLDLSPGQYEVVFQYVGYRQKIIKVTIGDEPKKLDVKLDEEAIKLTEVVVKADGEDPAYAVMRKAIAKREYYKKLVDNYSCNVYVKGVQKLLDAPEKILGQELGDLGGTLDSNRQGIIYLSESLANLHYQKPDQVKEVMISSKVSGNDNGFSWNQASSILFSLYEEHLEMQRQILSPLADNAFSYYRFRMEGTLFDEDGRLINKIEVIPKRSGDPVYSGYIYITEDLWNIQSFDLILTGKSIKIEVLDTLHFRQTHVPVKDPDVWMLLSQTLEFSFKAFGFKGWGNFTGVFSNYEINKSFDENFFSKEIFRVDEEANKKELTYWDSIRPIPLTQAEAIDYVRKDSLQKIWKSKTFKDSIDRKNNKFKVWSLLTGYSYNNSYKRRYFNFQSPLTTVQFNAVQGWYGDLAFNYRYEYDENFKRWFSFSPRLQYGFSDEKWRADASFTYNFNRLHFDRLTISGGYKTSQFNDDNPISPTINTLWSILGKENYLKLYDKKFVGLSYRRELVNGIFGFVDIEWARREALNNTSNSSFRKEDQRYESNHPTIPFLLGEEIFDPHNALTVNLRFRWRPGQTYMTYPGRKILQRSKWPDFWVNWQSAIPVNDDYVDYHRVTLEIRDRMNFGLVGNLNLRVQGGAFLSDDRVEFPDFQHFNGNRVWLGDPSNYNNSFLLLPYYSHSTTKPFVQAHAQHHFEGYILDKVPLIRNLGWKFVVGGHFLYTDEQQDYFEASVGFENIGWGLFRFFRVDGVMGFQRGKKAYSGILIGVNL